MSVLPVKIWKFINGSDDQEISNSIRKKVIDAINQSSKRHRWDYAGGNNKKGATRKDWNQTLLTLINFANKDFGGNAMIVSCEILAIMDDLEFFTVASDGGRNSGFYKAGILGNLTIYVDAFLPAPIAIIINDDFFINDNPECVVIYVDNIHSILPTGVISSGGFEPMTRG